MNELLLLTVNQAQEGQSAGPGGGLMGLMPLLVMFIIFYFLLIRPQKKRQRLQKEMLSRLKKGDVVVTAGGIIGEINQLKDDELFIEISDRVKIRVLRSQVNMYKIASTDAEKEE